MKVHVESGVILVPRWVLERESNPIKLSRGQDEIGAEIVKETEKAWGFRLAGEPEDSRLLWVPKSVCTDLRWKSCEGCGEQATWAYDGHYGCDGCKFSWPLGRMVPKEVSEK